jgi:hypothetical protein
MKKIVIIAAVCMFFLSGCVTVSPNLTNKDQSAVKNITVYVTDIKTEYEILGPVKISAINSPFPPSDDNLNRLLREKAYLNYSGVDAIINVGHYPMTVADGLIDLEVGRRAEGTAVKFTDNANVRVGIYGLGVAVLGTHISPKNLPHSFFNQEDLKEYFELNRQIGEHMAINLEWEAEDFYLPAEEILKLAKREGAKCHIYLSPISRDFGRNKPAIPKTVKGTSFGDPVVRKAYIDKLLQLASLNPDYLGLATEANLLSANREEFKYFVSLSKEAYKAIKEKYPSQKVTISFQWDVIKKESQYSILDEFKDSLDIYSFTSYPNILLTPYAVDIPGDYYSSILQYVPKGKIGFSEIGWFSGGNGSESGQAQFYTRLPELMEKINPEYIILILMHDIPSEFVANANFNSLGIRYSDGRPKKSWAIVTSH